MKSCLLCQMPRSSGEETCQLCGSAQFGPATERLPADFSLRLIGENRFAAAYEYLEGLVARGEESADHCHRLAWLAYAFGDLRAVETWSHETLRLDPSVTEPHLLMGLVLERSGRWIEAAETYSAGLRKSGGLPTSRATLQRHLDDVSLKIPEY